MQWTIEAPAKINIGLDIYRLKSRHKKHKLKSVFVLTKKYIDKITIIESDYLKIRYLLKTNTTFFKNDIISRAMNFLKDNFGIKTNYEILVEKNIPAKAGLGGSSADGGAIIKFFIEKEKLLLSKSMMKKIALELGSDIPFFISGYNAALVSMYGNKVKQINKNAPKFSIHENKACCDTRNIYKAFDDNWVKQDKNNFNKIIKSFNDLSSCKIINHLQNTAMELNPSLLDYKKSNLLMTGSGSYFISFKGE